MQFYGLLKTTLLDYPSLVAATVFTGGCNFRCPFCHNMDLVTDITANPISENEILHFLSSRAGILDGLCISGGEPTLNKDLPDFIRSVKSLGLKVKLDTNGTNPSQLDYLVNNKLIDYAAMDIKSSIDNYPEICGLFEVDTESVLESIQILKASPIDYEFRTTVIKEYHNKEIMNKIGIMLEGSKAYFLQSFVDSEFVINHSLHAMTKKELQELCQQLSKYIQSVNIRGID